MHIAFVYNLKRSSAEAEAEFDTPATVEALTGWMRSLGHSVTGIDAGDGASQLIARLEADNPDLVFNTAEGSHGRAREAFYPALFEQLGLAYTGSDAYGCCITLDKNLTKSVVAAAGVRVPRGMLVTDLSTFTLPADLPFPVFVKPNFEGSSKGIDQTSKVPDSSALMGKLAEMLRRYPEGVLVEEYVPGRDVAVSFLEGAVPDTGGLLPPVAYDYGGQDIYDYAMKNEDDASVNVSLEANVSERTRGELNGFASRAFRALHIRDVGRIDFRIAQNGDVYFLEVNALPSLEPGAGLYAAAAASGFARPERVLDAIIRSAASRQGKALGSGARKRRCRVGVTYNLKRTDDDAEAEFDSQHTIDAIASAIAEGGHEPVLCEATAELPSVLKQSGVQVVFNIAEGFSGRSREAQVPALLELMGIPFTGSDAATLALTLDKAMAKRLVRDEGVATAGFQVVSKKRFKPNADLRYPLIAKPLYEGSSKGIVGSPVVEDEDALREKVGHLLDAFSQPVLVEEFLPGREFTVGLLGTRRPKALPIMEVAFTGAAGERPIYSYEAKQSDQNLVGFVCPAVLDDAQAQQIVRLARKAYVALGCRDVGRIDIRMDGAGRPHFIECNPLPGLTPGFSDLCVIAEQAGMSYAQLIAEILSPAIRRLRVRSRPPTAQRL